MPFGGDMLDGLEGQRGGAQGGLKGQGRDVGGLSGRLCGVVGFVRRGKKVNCWFWTPFFCKMSICSVDVVSCALNFAPVGL